MKLYASEIRVGMLIEYKNDLWQVLKTQHVKPGKGGAFAQVEMKSVNKNTKLNERFRSSESVEKASLDETKFNYLYGDETDYYFMDPKTYEQINIKKETIGEKGKMLTENLEVSISFYNEKPLTVELPNQVTCTVDTTDVALKGQTVSSSYKPATLDNGVKIKGLAHITGGGLTENIPRILPKDCAVNINIGSWPSLPIFETLKELGNIDSEEMYRAFNMGVGMVFIVDQKSLDSISKILNTITTVYEIGKVVKGDNIVTYI